MLAGVPLLTRTLIDQLLVTKLYPEKASLRITGQLGEAGTYHSIMKIYSSRENTLFYLLSVRLH